MLQSGKPQLNADGEKGLARAAHALRAVFVAAAMLLCAPALAQITVNPATLPVGTVGTAYSRTISATGGTGAKTFSVSSGALPTGLALNPTSGVLAGTPTAAGTNSFTIRATDTLGATGFRAYVLTINPPVVVNPLSVPSGTVGVAYSQTFSATGGNGSYTYARSAGTLPAGLTLNSATGVLSGTPTAAATRTFTIRATDGTGAIGTRSYTVTIAAAIVVNPTTLPGGTVGSAYSRTISSTGGTGAKTYSIGAGALPAGLVLNSTTGVISGTPASAGVGSFTIVATDTVGATGSRAYSVTINPAIVVNPATLPNGYSGVAYSQTVGATGGTGTYTFSVSAGSLGGGLALNASTGIISGTPTTAGTRNFTIRATDGNATVGTRAYTIRIYAAVTVSPTTLPNGTVGTAYSRTVTAAGGAGGFTFSISAGSLPVGLTLNSSTGVISGTPTLAGTNPFTVRATDSNGVFGSRAYSVTVAPAPVVVVPASLPGGAVGSPYAQVVGATGGNGSYTFSISAGSLPVGLTLNASTGAISGTPTVAGSRSFTIRATDGVGAIGSRAYTVLINAAIVVNPAALAGGNVGAPYSQSITASGGSGGFTYSVSAGALPAGLSLNAASGLLNGTPTATGSSAFTIRATDSNGAYGTRAYSVTINPGIVVNPAALPNGTVGAAYLQAVSASGGNGSYTFTVSAGTLPAGLALNSASGAISGTPSAAGTSSFTIRATDGAGATGSRSYSLTINAAVVVNPAGLPGGTVGVAYSQVVSASGGNGSYTYSVSAGALPPGLMLNPATGAIGGTPGSAGTSSFTIRATDGSGATGSRAYSVTINAAISVNPAALPPATVGTAYVQTVTASGGTGSFTYSVTAGALPAGLALNAASGAVSGTPTTVATNSFTVTATDGNGATGSRAYSITVNPAVVVNPATLPAGTVGAAYSQTVTATGGSGSYAYSISTGALPAGLSLNAASGLISGTPTAAATSAFTIRALDSNGASGSRAYSVTVNAGMAVGPAALPSAAVGAPYAQTVVATGGTGSYTYSVSLGSLPAGLTLGSSTGALSGTPTAAGTSSFTITATDSNGATASRAYPFTVNPALALNPATLPSGTAGTAYSQTLVASGGNGSFTYSVSTGALPAGLTLQATTGALTGTPTTAAGSNFTVTATDGNGATIARAYLLTIHPAIVVNPPELAGGTVGAPYNQTISASGGNGSFTYSVTSGSLPAGLGLNAASGVIGGTPTTAGSYTFTVTATDGSGANGARSFTVAVVAATLTLESASLDNGVVGSPYSQSIVVSGGVAPYAFSIANGQLPAGVALNPATGGLSGTPTRPGAYAFSVRIVDANGASGVFPQAIVVEPRADPTQDPAVRGILASQLSAASRFGAAQIQNIGARIRMLHFGQDPCSLSFDISANIRWEQSSAGTEPPSSAVQGGKNDPKQDEKNQDDKRCDSPLAVWAAGAVDFGFLRPSTATSRSDFTTSGLTLGADARVLPGLVLGGSLGYGRDTSDIDSSAGDSRAQTVNAALYGSYEPLKSLYLDFALGYGNLGFDSMRWQNRTLTLGGRDGSQIFGSLSVSGMFAVGDLQVAPYGRFDRVRSRLGGYVESGPAGVALNYGEVTAIEDIIAAGFYASYRIPLGRALLEPSLRLEARRVRASAVDQPLAYADMPTYGYVLAEGSASDTQALGGLGLVLRMAGEFSLGIEYSYTGSSATYRSETVRAIARAPF